MKHAVLVIVLILMTLLTQCYALKPEGPTVDPAPAGSPDPISTPAPVYPDPVPASEEEIEGLKGYWRSGNSYYLEIGEEELTIRDSMKRPIMETGYTVMKSGEKLLLVPEDDIFTYYHLAEPYATMTELYLEDGKILLHYYHHYTPDEIREETFEATDAGPFDDLLIRDEEYLEELQGRWIDDRHGSYILTIDGNHMSVSYGSSDDVLDETDFHVISYKFLPDRLYLIKDDLIETEFYAFTRFEYLDGKLCTSEMVMDADWDTSLDFVREN